MALVRSIDTLQEWIDDFRSLGYVIAEHIRVIRQDSSVGDTDEGLVVFEIDDVPASIYIEAATGGKTSWVGTVEPREEPMDLTAAEMIKFSTALAHLSALTAYLEARAQNAGERGPHPAPAAE